MDAALTLVSMEMLFGTVELQKRAVCDGNRMGYESRKIRKDRDGIVVEVGEWQPPSCWLVFPEPEPVRRPWWTRLKR